MKNVILLPLAALISGIVILGSCFIFVWLFGQYLGPIVFFLVTLGIIGYKMDKK